MQKITLVLFLIESISFKAFANGLGYGSFVMPAATPNPANNCIVSICGEPSEKNSSLSQYLSAQAKINGDPNNAGDFPDDVKALFRELKQSNEELHRRAEKKFSASQILSADKPQGFFQAIYNLLALAPYLSKLVYKSSAAQGPSEVDEKATLEALKDLPAAEKKRVIELAKYSLERSKSEPLSNDKLISLPVDILLKLAHPKMDLSEAAKAEYQAAQESLAKIKNLPPIAKEIYFNSVQPEGLELIGKNITMDRASENELRTLLKWNIDYRSSYRFFENPDSPLRARETPSYEEIENELGGPKAVAKLIKDQQTEWQIEDEQKIRECKALYILNSGVLPSGDQIGQLKRDIEQAKMRVANLVSTRFPASEKKLINDVVMETNFVLPPSVSEFKSAFKSYIEANVAGQKGNFKSVDKMSNDDVHRIYIVLAFAKAHKDKNESDTRANKFCDPFKYLPLSDENYTGIGSVMLSYSTATGSPEARLTVIEHELGHSVSKVIRSSLTRFDKFVGLHKCLAAAHTEELPPERQKAIQEAKEKSAYFAGPYMEEDFADMIAAEAQAGKNAKNGWCPAMGINADNHEYTDSSLVAPARDTHSADLFRLLSIEYMNKGSLPDSCERYLKAQNLTSHFSHCLDRLSPAAGLRTGRSNGSSD